MPPGHDAATEPSAPWRLTIGPSSGRLLHLERQAAQNQFSQAHMLRCMVDIQTDRTPLLIPIQDDALADIRGIHAGPVGKVNSQAVCFPESIRFSWFVSPARECTMHGSLHGRVHRPEVATAQGIPSRPKPHAFTIALHFVAFRCLHEFTMDAWRGHGNRPPEQFRRGRHISRRFRGATQTPPTPCAGSAGGRSGGGSGGRSRADRQIRTARRFRRR